MLILCIPTIYPGKVEYTKNSLLEGYFELAVLASKKQ